jgi:predicted small secreted protein
MNMSRIALAIALLTGLALLLAACGGGGGGY